MNGTEAASSQPVAWEVEGVRGDGTSFSAELTVGPLRLGAQRVYAAVVRDVSLRKEREWLPRLAPLLPVAVPEPVHAGTPTADFPAPWSVYRWIDGAEAGPDTVRDWAAFGADLAAPYGTSTAPT